MTESSGTEDLPAAEETPAPETGTPQAGTVEAATPDSAGSAAEAESEIERDKDEIRRNAMDGGI